MQPVRPAVAFQEAQSESRFGLQNIPFHTHNGVDSPAIKASDLIENPVYSAQGTIVQTGMLTFNFDSNFTPSKVTLNGTITNLVSPISVLHTIGTANLGKAFDLVPSTSNPNVWRVDNNEFPRSQRINNQNYQVPIQSSSFFGVITGLGTLSSVSRYLCELNTTSGLFVRILVVNFAKGKVDILVETLGTNWRVVADINIY